MSPKYPTSNVFYRCLTAEMSTAVRGEGIYLYDQDGNEFIDGSGGALVVNVGHGVAEIANSMSNQAQKLAYVSGLHFTNEPVEELNGFKFPKRRSSASSAPSESRSGRG